MVYTQDRNKMWLNLLRSISFWYHPCRLHVLCLAYVAWHCRSLLAIMYKVHAFKKKIKMINISVNTDLKRLYEDQIIMPDWIVFFSNMK